MSTETQVRWYTARVSHHITRALETLAADSPHAALLLSQWNFDRAGLAQSLGSVAYTFPHYSRHDHSHADEILVKIYRILGDARVSRLTSTDLWLLLEAAYSHDIGMVVDDASAREWIKSPDYRQFLDRLMDGGDDLAEAARRLETQNYENTEAWALDIRRDLVSVFAEYARREHARRAEQVILAPEGIGLQSPRTSQVPSRLWRVLARICRGHGESFEKVMNLPFRETGLGADHCHPRFIACMLRLGDLLDLDNGRFCETMLSAFGEPLAATRAHMGKHAAVEHLDVDRTTIEVTANCTSYEEYEATEAWFDMLRSELAQQSSKWAHIAPDPDFGTLPSLGEVKASLHEVKLLLLDSNKRPRFTVDRDAVMALIRGNKLYSDPVVWIRELLQNSIDATLLRLYIDDPATAACPPKAPLDWLREQIARYPIRLVLRRLGREGAFTRWDVRIIDQGIGISKEDLKYIQTIGSSALNPARRQFRRQMPEWMWPSGIFGIGLQSVFMAADAITITTHHAQKNDAFRIRIEKSKSPRGQTGDLICIEEIEHLREKTGCEIALEWKVPAIAERASMDSKLLRDFDGCGDQELPDLIERACAKVEEVSAASIARIVLETSLGTNPDQETVKPLLMRHWSAENSVDISIRRIGTSLTESFRTYYYYRGMEIANAERSRTRLPLLDRLWIDFDLFCGSARDLLNVERSDFTHDASHEIDRRTMLGFLDALVKLRTDAPTEHSVMLSLVMECIERARGKNCLPPYLDLQDLQVTRILRDVAIGAREDFKRCELGGGLTISDCLGSKSVLMSNHHLSRRSKAQIDTAVYVKTIPTNGKKSKWIRTSTGTDKVLFLLSNTISIIRDRTYGRVLRLNFGAGFESESQASTDEMMIWTLENLFTNRLRHVHPCPRRFSALAVADLPSWAWPIGFLSLEFMHSFKAFTGQNIMVCPFSAASESPENDFGRLSSRTRKIVLVHLTNLLEWTWQHRAQPAATRRQIADAMTDFIVHVDRLMKTRWNASYDLSDAQREIDKFLAAP